MKICFANTNRKWGGGEKWHFDAACSLANRGFEVCVAGFPGGELTALLPTDDTATLEADGMTTTGAIKLKLERPGQPPQILEVRKRSAN